MIQKLVLCCLVSLVFAANPSWVDEWYVVNITNNNPDNIIPQNGTIVNITQAETGGLVIYGLGTDNLNFSWWLSWDSYQQTAHFCDFDACMNGTLMTDSGVVYANVTWYDSESFSSIVMTPAELNWLGRWYIVLSKTDSQSDCEVPKMLTYAEIAASGNTLKMIGTALDSSSYSWDLDWTANEVKVQNACSGGLCASGSVSLIDWVLSANIDWTTSNNLTCSVTMVSRSSDLLGEYDNQGPYDLTQMSSIVIIEDNFESSEPWIGFLPY